MVVNPLNGLKVAPFYGCHIIRPESVNGWESARNPHSLEDVITAIGGEAIDYAGKTRCCGFHVQLEKEGIAANMVGQNMRMAKDAGAEAVLTPCPLCHLALDGYQADSAERWGRTDLPTFHLPQLVALALGVDPAKLGLQASRDLARPDPPSARTRARCTSPKSPSGGRMLSASSQSDRVTRLTIRLPLPMMEVDGVDDSRRPCESGVASRSGSTRRSTSASRTSAGTRSSWELGFGQDDARLQPDARGHARRPSTAARSSSRAKPDAVVEATRDRQATRARVPRR